MVRFKHRKRSGFSLMELLAVVTILGIIAAIIVPRVTVSSDTAKQKVDAHNKATINAAVERFYIETGSWPANDLSDIGADTDYFPDGIPTNPVNGSSYALDATTHRVL
jgi:general secretion pathway protein G